MRSECACLRLTLSRGVFNGIVNYLGKRKRRATLATWSRTTGKCATDLEGLFVRPAPVKEWFRQPESNQHPVVRSHEFYPLDYGGMKKLPVPVGYWLAADGRGPHTTPVGCGQHGGRLFTGSTPLGRASCSLFICSEL